MAEPVVIGNIPVELTDKQQRLWDEGTKKGRRQVRKEVKQARKDWHKENLDGLNEEPAEDYDSMFGGEQP